MPLKIRVKPEGKIFAGGAVLKNVGTRPADLLILSDSPVLREGYLMNMDRRDESDASNVYFLLQIIYLFKGRDKPMDKLVIDTLKGFAGLYPDFKEVVSQIIVCLENKETFKALKVAHAMLAQYESKTHVQRSDSDPVSEPVSAAL